MSSAASTPESSRTRGGQRSNALKNAEKFFKPYTWATEGNIDKELTDEQLTEVRGQRLKLTKALRQLKDADPRKQHGEVILEKLDAKR